jgi:stearoyl-CoA desaturase (delta-9 desaturase)
MTASGQQNYSSADEPTDCAKCVEKKDAPKRQIVWRNVMIFVVLHLAWVYGSWLFLSGQVKLLTIVWTVVLYHWNALGITAGAHRLWAHKTYKAKYPLQCILVFFNWIAVQNDVIEWARDHRCHHKYSETSADPHNATRGFFFAHMGWLLVKKHPDVIEKGKGVNIDDLLQDELLLFQRRYYWPMAVLLCFVMPSVVPLLWGESVIIAYFTAAVWRYITVLHVTWCVNSVAHMFGNRPYDKFINPRQSFVTALGAIGEGWHNYHHAFPQDYRASEFPYYINFTTMFLEFFQFIGQASDLKTPAKQMIKQRKERTGDGSTY